MLWEIRSVQPYSWTIADILQAALIEGLEAAVLADKAYDADGFLIFFVKREF
jgi:hypothetical protein